MVSFWTDSQCVLKGSGSRPADQPHQAKSKLIEGIRLLGCSVEASLSWGEIRDFLHTPKGAARSLTKTRALSNSCRTAPRHRLRRGTCLPTIPCPSFSPITTKNHPDGRVLEESGARTPILHESRSEEHTSELQSLRHLVCRLLLEKKTT